MQHNEGPSLTSVTRLLFVAICALTACRPAVPSTASPNDSQIPITFVALSLDLGHYEALAQAFNAAHPAIRVQVRDPDTLLSSYDLSPAEVMRLLASSADVFFAHELDPATLGATGVVHDLQPLLETHQEFDAEDFFPGLLERYQGNGRLWGIPAGISPRVALYNKTLFDAARVDYPQPGWTWDDFLTKALALTDRDAGVWGFTEQWSYDSVGAFVYQHGGALVENDGPDFRDPLAAEALDWYADLARTHRVMPGPDSPDAPQMHNRLALDGRAGMWIGFLSQNRSTDTGIAPLPRDRQDASMATVYAYYVSAGTTHPEAAWQWVAFLTRQLPETGLLPARRSVFDSSAYRSRVDAETYAVYRYILEHLEDSPWPGRYPWFAAAYDWLVDEGLPAMMRGESDAADVLAQAQSRALAAMAQAPETDDAPVVIVQPSVAPPDTTGLTFLQMWAVGDAYRELAHIYQQEHSDIVVRVTSFRSGVDYPPDRIARVADVFPVFSGFRMADVEEHWLNLQPLAESDPNVALDDFYPPAVAAYRRQGNLWGLPVEIDAQVLFYNKSLFDQTGVPHPQSGWTWDDFMAAAAQLTHGEGVEKQWGFVTLVNGWEYIPLIVAAQNGGALVNSRAAPTAPTLDDPAVVDAVRWYVGLCRTYGVMPPPATRFANWEKMEVLVSEGRAAMWISSVGSRDWRNMVIGVAPLPIPSRGGQPATDYTVVGYGISAQTPDPQEAWRWLTFLTRQPGAMRALPARRSLAAQAALPFVPPELRAETLHVYQLILDNYADAGYSEVEAQAPWFDAVYRLYRYALKQTFEAGTDPAENLYTAQAIAEAYMACLETHGGLTDPTVGEACEKEAGVPAPVVWYEE